MQGDSHSCSAISRSAAVVLINDSVEKKSNIEFIRSKSFHDFLIIITVAYTCVNFNVFLNHRIIVQSNLFCIFDKMDSLVELIARRGQVKAVLTRFNTFFYIRKTEGSWINAAKLIHWIRLWIKADYYA